MRFITPFHHTKFTCVSKKKLSIRKLFHDKIKVILIHDDLRDDFKKKTVYLMNCSLIGLTPLYLCSLDKFSIVKFGFDPHPPYPKFHHYTNL